MKNQFLNGHNLRKLNTEFKKHLESSDHWKNHRSILIKTKRFTQVDILSGRRNNVSSVVQIENKLVECSSAYWLTGTRWTPALYVKASAHESHGFGSKTQVLLIFKDIKGRKESMELFKSWDFEQFEIRDCMISENRIEKIKDKSWDVRRRYMNFLKHTFKKALYDSMYDLEHEKIPEDLSKLCSFLGIDLLEAISFTYKFTMHDLKGAKRTKNTIKLAIKNVSTYCSLPSTLEIIFCKSEPKLLRLSELKIETSGYYDHSENLKIRPEQLKEAKKLQREFNLLKGGV